MPARSQNVYDVIFDVFAVTPWSRQSNQDSEKRMAKMLVGVH
jgi:hypothetical protein